ncbi:MAG: hypothetical protein P9L97_02685 [Candidatus Tenebribacter davisii]|nr:hypothetical protein [Candidatus Tenebribacter davisii]
MKKVLTFILLLPIFLYCEVTHEYKISSGDEIYYSSFSIDNRDSEIRYIYQHGPEEQVNYYTLDGTTKKFTFQDSTKNINLSAVREGEKIIITENTGTKVTDTIVSLDKSPWQQSMSYSLSEFALSNADKTQFWIIRLDKFKGEKMQAIKDVTEDIVIDNKLYDAIKIKISASGLRSKFWHGYYWFRTSDGLFLRYEGLNGLPGSTKTIIEYQNKG